MSDIPLKEHIEAQIKWVDRYFLAQVEFIHASVAKAEEKLTTRLEGMNEIRQAMEDQSGSFATREALEHHAKEDDRRLKILEINKAALEGKAVVLSTVTSVVVSVLVSVLVGIVVFFVTKSYK